MFKTEVIRGYKFGFSFQYFTLQNRFLQYIVLNMFRYLLYSSCYSMYSVQRLHRVIFLFIWLNATLKSNNDTVQVCFTCPNNLHVFTSYFLFLLFNFSLCFELRCNQQFQLIWMPMKYFIFKRSFVFCFVLFCFVLFFFLFFFFFWFFLFFCFFVFLFFCMMLSYNILNKM